MRTLSLPGALAFVASRNGGGSAPLNGLQPSPGEDTFVSLGNVSGAHQYDAGSEVHFIEAKGSPVSARIGVSPDGLSYTQVTWSGGDSGIYATRYINGVDSGNPIGYTGGLSLTSGTLIRFGFDALRRLRIYIDGSGTPFVSSAVQTGPFYTGVAFGSGTTATAAAYGGDLDELYVASISYSAETKRVTATIGYYCTETCKMFAEIDSDGANEVTYEENATPGFATISWLCEDHEGDTPVFTLTLRDSDDNTLRATEVYALLTIPAPIRIGMNLTDVSPGWNGNSVVNKALGGEWQDNSGFASYLCSANPTYISRKSFPLQPPPGGTWLHKLLQPGENGQKFRVEFNGTGVAFSLDNNQVPLATQQTGGGKTWRDYTFSDLGNIGGAYPDCLITNLGTATEMTAYAIDGSGNPVWTGFWQADYITESARYTAGARMMDYQKINGSLQTWNDTVRVKSDEWLPGTDGFMSIERIAELGETRATPDWWCIPWKATEAMVRLMCQKIILKLGSRIVRIELANEVFNSAFALWQIASDEGAANDVKMPDNSTPAGPHDFALCRQAQRHVEVMTWVGEEFATAGKTSQLRRVISLQTVPGNFNTVINNPNYNVKSVTESISAAFYVGAFVRMLPTPTNDLDIIFERLYNAPVVGFHAVKDTFAQMVALTRGVNKEFVAYEMSTESLGEDPGGGWPADIEKIVFDDPRTGILWDDMLGWYRDNVGGDVFLYQEMRNGGRYGIREHPYQTREESYRYDSVLKILEAA